MSQFSREADLLRAAYDKSVLEGRSKVLDDVRLLAGLTYEQGRAAAIELERAGIIKITGDLG